MGRGEMEESCRAEETAACRGELERRGSCITQWRAAEEGDGERRNGELQGEETAACRGEMEERRAAERRGSCITQRRAAEELDGGEERWGRGELPMREERKLHHAAEELDGGEESCR